MVLSGTSISQASNWAHLYTAPPTATPPPADVSVAPDAAADTIPTKPKKPGKPIDLRPAALKAATRKNARLEKRRPVASAPPAPAMHVAQAKATPVSEADAAKSVDPKAATASPAVATIAPPAQKTAVAQTSAGSMSDVYEANPVDAQAAATIPAVVKAARPLDPNIPMYDLIAKHAQLNGVPVKLAAAIIQIESRYQARVVHAGNYGLMQIRAQTARGMGFLGPVAALTDPETNLRFGMKYLGQAYRLAKGDLCYTLMRYQSGFGTSHPNAANRAYCAKAHLIMAHS